MNSTSSTASSTFKPNGEEVALTVYTLSTEQAPGKQEFTTKDLEDSHFGWLIPYLDGGHLPENIDGLDLAGAASAYYFKQTDNENMLGGTLRDYIYKGKFVDLTRMANNIIGLIYGAIEHAVGCKLVCPKHHGHEGVPCDDYEGCAGYHAEVYVFYDNEALIEACPPELFSDSE